MEPILARRYESVRSPRRSWMKIRRKRRQRAGGEGREAAGSRPAPPRIEASGGIGAPDRALVASRDSRSRSGNRRMIAAIARQVSGGNGAGTPRGCPIERMPVSRMAASSSSRASSWSNAVSSVRKAGGMPKKVVSTFRYAGDGPGAPPARSRSMRSAVSGGEPGDCDVAATAVATSSLGMRQKWDARSWRRVSRTA